MSYLRDKRSVTSFTFVFVTGAMMEGPQTAYVETIITTLEDLANGTYLKRAADIDPRSRVHYKALAADVRGSPKLTETVFLEGLGEFLARRTAETNGGQPVIDVTGLPKILTAHVMLICLVGGYQVHAFELRNKVNHARPELSLYFALPAGGFDYPALTRDPAVLTSIRQLVHVRRVMWTTAALSTIGVICFASLLLVDTNNPVLAAVGLTANVIGIAGGVLQALTTRTGR
ncbi:hypothetical protein [Phytohabitans suffuscus]